MNALIAFRNNTAGTMSIRPKERMAVQEEIVSTLKTKLMGTAATQKSGLAKEAGDAAASALDNELDKDAFLRLLVTQLQNQDPLEPVDNTDMIAQLAQFSALEQQNNLNESFEGLSEQFGILTGNVDQLNFISAQGLIGKYIQGIDINGQIIEGRVDAVHLDGSIVVLSVDETLVPMTGVVTVGDQAPTPDTTPETEDTEGDGS